jgi:hypothetical protein
LPATFQPTGIAKLAPIVKLMSSSSHASPLALGMADGIEHVHGVSDRTEQAALMPSWTPQAAIESVLIVLSTSAEPPAQYASQSPKLAARTEGAATAIVASAPTRESVILFMV